MKILIAQINPTIGDFSRNTEKILHGIQLAKEKAADIVLFPEMSLSGYPPEDLLLIHSFIEACEEHLQKIIDASSNLIVILGMPRKNPNGMEKKLYNSAAIIQNQQLLGFQDKSLLPTYDVFDERRYFEPGPQMQTWELKGKKIGITICEDIWEHSRLVHDTSYHCDPIKYLKKHQPDLVLNLSASPYSLVKFHNRLKVCSKAASALNCPLILCNQVGGNDSLIFDGYSLYMGADGSLLECAKGFNEDFVLVDLTQKLSPSTFNPNPIEDLYHALVLGLRDYFEKSGFKQACLGLSGGVDSALVACIATDALGAKNVLGIYMPSIYSSEESRVDAQQLAQAIEINIQEIPIESPFNSYLTLLNPYFNGKAPDVTEENLQARIRGMILMAISNKLGHIVLSTGNKSELAMGYSTLYGDMCGGLGVISDVTKMEVYALANWINRNKEIIPLNTIQKAPSAELKPNQKDQDTLPDYSIVDNVLKAYVEDYKTPEEITKQYGYSLALVQDLIRRIHRNEYKRRQSSPGLRVSEKALSIGRKVPIVQQWIK